MREIRTSGSEGGGNEPNHFSLPLSAGGEPLITVRLFRHMPPAGSGLHIDLGIPPGPRSLRGASRRRVVASSCCPAGGA
jgi:hypothetical protein